MAFGFPPRSSYQRIVTDAWVGSAPVVPTLPIDIIFPDKLRVVGTNNRPADLYLTTTAALSRMMQRTYHPLAGAVSELYVTIPNYVQTNAPTNGETANTNQIVVNKLALVVNGVNYPLTFGGSPSGIGAPGEHLRSDSIPESLFGTTLQDDIVEIRGDFGVVAVGDRLPTCVGLQIGNHAAWAGNAGYVFPVATVQSAAVEANVYGLGVFTAPAGINNNMTNGATNSGRTIPVWICGRYKSNKSFTVMGMGDSIMTSVGDPNLPPSYRGNTTVSGSGYFMRASIDAMTSKGAFGALNLSVSGAQSMAMLLNSKRMEAAAMADIVIDALGSNDLGNITLATLLDQKRALWVALRARGVKVIVETIFPRTQNSNTAPTASFVPGGDRDQFNAQLAIELAEGRIDGILDNRHITGTPEGLWTSATDTVDQIHITGAVSRQLSHVLRAYILGKKVIPNQFTLPTITGAAPGAMVAFPAFTPTGFTDPTKLEFSGTGDYQIDGGDWTAFTNGGIINLNPGQSLSARIAASATSGAVVSTVLRIAGVRATFTVMTA